jgi:hypothetical protein
MFSNGELPSKSHALTIQYAFGTRKVKFSISFEKRRQLMGERALMRYPLHG